MKIICSEITKAVGYFCRGVNFCVPKDGLKNALKIVVFLEIGQQVEVIDGSIESAINQGICGKQNTDDNVSAKIYTEIVSGDQLKIFVCVKSDDVENMSDLKMLKSPQARYVVLGCHVKHFI